MRMAKLALGLLSTMTRAFALSVVGILLLTSVVEAAVVKVISSGGSPRRIGRSLRSLNARPEIPSHELGTFDGEHAGRDSAADSARRAYRYSDHGQGVCTVSETFRESVYDAVVDHFDSLRGGTASLPYSRARINKE